MPSPRESHQDSRVTQGSFYSHQESHFFISSHTTSCLRLSSSLASLVKAAFIHFCWSRFLQYSLEMCPFVGVCVVFTCVSTCVPVHSCMCTKAKGRHRASCSFPFHLIPLRQSLSLILRLTDLARQSGQRAPGTCLSLQPLHWGYSHTQPCCALSHWC